MTNDDRVVDDRSLREADRRLTWLEDIILEDEGAVPAWVVAARTAVHHEQQRRGSDE